MMNSEPAPIVAPDAISDRDLVLQFESLGDNCEFGLVQRKAGAEPLGLLRFSSAPIRPLLRALRDRFEGLADPANVRLSSAKGEYLITLMKYDFVYHTDVRVGEMDPDVLHRQQIRILPFLVKKLIGDLEEPEKILVFRQNESLAANDLLDLRAAMAGYGPATMLWMQQTRPGHPPGTVEQVDARLMTGYVQRLADRETVPDLDLASWLGTLRRAYAMWRARPATGSSEATAPENVPPAASIEIVFGLAGNALSFARHGWSPAEDHHMFAIDDHSLLTFAPPADAPEYRLEMDIAPFLAPPTLTSQRLEVTVNGELVLTLDDVQSDVVNCSVPRRLVHGHDQVDILLTHPQATRPLDVGLGTDTRRLAVMFRRLTLTGMAESAVSPDPTPSSLMAVLFGSRGQPGSDADHGWSPQVSDFVWAFDDRSLLILARPADAANYQLEMDMLPFDHPEALTAERLEVMVNGALVHTFYPVPVGLLSCVVPGRLIRGRDKVEILLIHPRAVKPADLDGNPGIRRRALIFHRVTLVALPE
jgi:hypothetical protein